jgi:hypothetical protein
MSKRKKKHFLFRFFDEKLVSDKGRQTKILVKKITVATPSSSE